MDSKIAQLIDRKVIYTIEGVPGLYLATSRVYCWLTSPKEKITDIASIIRHKGIGYLFADSSSLGVDVYKFRSIIRLIDDIYHGYKLLLQLPDLNLSQKEFLLEKMSVISGLLEFTGLSSLLPEIRRLYIDKPNKVS